jgi:hypothetical protein
LRSADRQQILLETRRDIDRGDRPPGADRPGAPFRSSARSATPGATAIDWARFAETAERSASTTTTSSPRTTVLLNVQVRTAKAISGTTRVSR